MNFLKKLFAWTGSESDTGYKVADAVPWPEPPKSAQDIYQEQFDKLKIECDELNKTEIPFEIGDYVKYTKIPNDLLLGVYSYTKNMPNLSFPKPTISESRVTAQYFVNGELKTIIDSAKWFEKVERK